MDHATLKSLSYPVYMRYIVRTNLKNVQSGLRSVWLAGLALACLLYANVVAADVITGTADTSALDDGTGDLPAPDLSGWFFTLDPQQPFPTEPDPSLPWTSPENIATLNYWLSLVFELGDDPSLLAQLYGLGMVSSPVSEVTTEQTPGNVAEPVTQGLFVGGLALLGLYALERARRLRSEPTPAAIIRYGPL